MDERWAERWRLSGAKVRCAKGADDRGNRVMVVSVGGERGGGAGGRRGWEICACYAPVNDPRAVAARERFYEDVRRVCGQSRRSDFLIIGGDMNAVAYREGGEEGG
eukprot:15459219-Alexandrium_andersonii.AAC.1